MPDWSYHPLKQAVLTKMEAKKSRAFIHQAMHTVATIPFGKQLIEFLGHNKTSTALQQTIHNTHFPSPIGLSGRIDPKLSGTIAFQELGFGFLELGPIVYKSETEIAPIWQNEHIAFSATLPEKVSLKSALQLLLTKKLHVPIVARMDESLQDDELHYCIEQLAPFIDGLLLTAAQIKRIKNIPTLPIYQVVPSDTVKEALSILPSVQGIVVDAPFFTQQDRMIEAPDSNEQLRCAVEAIRTAHPQLPIITVGGIEQPADALRLKNAGAQLMLLSEGYVKAGPGLPKRIHERLLHEQTPTATTFNWQWSFLFGLAIFIGGLIALFFAFTTVILQYDEQFIGLTREEILVVNPNILAFMAHDRMSLAGTMLSASLLYMAIAYFGLRRGLHWAKISFHSAALSGFLGILLFIGYGYFDWLHGLFWLLLLPLYALSWRETKSLQQSPSSQHDTNDRAWHRALYGQLLFVTLGFALIVGGAVISLIGISTVFVKTDIAFLCMDEATLQAISDKLIPVIAHDRAGFGSALISTGILVLSLALWGFRAGERWLWLTILFGALPAFIAGLGTHFAIGYTSFVHLLPLYLLTVLYIAGLALSYTHLMRRK